MRLFGCSIQRKNSWAGGRPLRILPVDGLINRLSPSISGKNLGDIIKVSFCCSIALFFRLRCVSAEPPNTKIWIHSNVPSVASFRDVCVYSLSMTQSLPEILPDPPLSPFPRWHSKLHLRALTWIQNTSLLTTRVTSFNLPVVAMVSFWLNVHTPSLQLASRRSTYLNRN